MTKSTLRLLAIAAAVSGLWADNTLRAADAPAVVVATKPAAPASLLPANMQTLSLNDFAALCNTLINAGNEAGGEREKAGAYAYASYLSKPTTLATASGDQVASMTMLAVPASTERQRAVIRDTVLTSLASGASVQDLTLKKVSWLVGPGADQLLIPEATTQGWVQSWLGAHQNGAGLSLSDSLDACEMTSKAYAKQLKPLPAVLQSLIQNVVANTSGWDQASDMKVVLQSYGRVAGLATEEQRQTLLKYLWNRINGDLPKAVAGMDWQGVSNIRGTLGGLKLSRVDFAPVIATFLTTRANELSADNLADATVALRDVGDVPKIKDVRSAAYQSVAQALLAKLSAEPPVSDQVGRQSFVLGVAFESPAHRQQLRQLMASGGTTINRLNAAKILAAAEKNVEQLDEFKKEAAGRAADKQLDADTRAYWMLAAAEADRVTPIDPVTKLKRRWMEKALATAQGESLRLVIVEEYAQYFTEIGYPEFGVSFMASIQGQFQGPSAERVKTLKKNLEQAKSNQEAAAKARKEGAVRQFLASDLKYFQESLKRAELARDTASIQRMQKAISEVQAKIDAGKPKPATQPNALH